MNSTGHVCVVSQSKADHWMDQKCNVMFFFLNAAPALLRNFVSGYFGTKEIYKTVGESQSINQNNSMRMERNIARPEYTGYLPASVGQRDHERQGDWMIEIIGERRTKIILNMKMYS